MLTKHMPNMCVEYMMIMFCIYASSRSLNSSQKCPPQSHTTNIYYYLLLACFTHTHTHICDKYMRQNRICGKFKLFEQDESNMKHIRKGGGGDGGRIFFLTIKCATLCVMPFSDAAATLTFV